MKKLGAMMVALFVVMLFAGQVLAVELKYAGSVTVLEGVMKDAAPVFEKKEGIKELTEDAMKGEKAMPPKGGCSDCTEAEIKAAVQYMIDSARKK